MSLLEVIKPDGVKTSNPSVVYSTLKEEVILRGNIEGYTELSISFNGTTYTSTGLDADISILDNSWVFPSYGGIDVSQGTNSFEITATGAGLGSKVIRLDVVSPENEQTTPPNPPTNIRISRLQNAVEISFNHSDSAVSYYNVYASTTSGGGNNGYFLVNAIPLDPVTFGERTEQSTEIGNLSVDLSPEDADPLFVGVQALQKSNLETLSTTSLGDLSILEGTTRIRVSSVVSSLTLTQIVKFKHNRSATPSSSPPTYLIGEFSTLPSTQPIYYVATAVKVTNDVEIESTYSIEVAGQPIDVQTTNLSLPNVSDNDLTTSLIESIYAADPDASVQAGSAIRDLMIDPMVSELSRVRFVLDYTYRATSFLSLLRIDDPLNTGASISVSASSYKLALKDALFLQTDAQTQNLIDSSFDRLASNFGLSRRIGVKARGEVVFYTSSKPTYTISVPLGNVLTGGGVSFKTTQTGSFSPENASSLYNPVRKRYELTLQIEAINEGASGNVTSGQITQGAPAGLRVSNTAPTFGGQDTESNSDLSARALGYLSSVDVGTRNGYYRVARETTGVTSVQIIDADSPYMIRDEGLGGKVDVWVRGENIASVTDVYAPTYKTKRGARFLPLVSEGAYIFKVADNTAPILFEMIDREDLGLGLRNATTNEFFDLSNMTISNGNTITLDSSLVQPSYAFGDIILGDYRSDTSNNIVLDRQPVREVLSVAKEDGSLLDFEFVKAEDPLRLGQSTRASDYVIVANDGLEKFKEVSNESHTLIGFYGDRLAYKGVDVNSIVVTSSTGVVFDSPLDPSVTTPAYEIINEGEQVSIRRTSKENGIADGQVVLVSYRYIENLTITYKTNLVLSNLQASLEANKHLGADVLAKEVSPVFVDIKAVVVLDKGTSISSADSLIRNNLSNLILGQVLGGTLRVSDVIREIDGTTGVSYVIMPITQLALQQGASVLREEISIGTLRAIALLNNNTHLVWILDTKLSNVVGTGGGTNAKVFLDGAEIPLLSVSQRGLKSNWIRTSASLMGLEGLSVYDPSISAYVNIAESQNKVLLCLPVGDHPSNHSVSVNYTTGDSTGVVSDVLVNEFSYLQVGDLSFTYEEER